MTDEQARLDEVRRYDVLDTAPEAAFDRLAELAARACDAPIAFVAIVDAARVWHKAEHGAKLVERPREGSPCARALGQKLLIADGDAAVEGTRFYAGAPLVTPRGIPLGTLCVLDRRARALPPESERLLLMLRDEVMRVLDDRRELVELRRAEGLRQEAVEALLAVRADLERRIDLRTREAEEARQRIRSILARVADGFVALDREWRYEYVNERAAQMFNRRPEDLVGKHIWSEFPEGIGQPFHLAYERAMREQVPLTISDHYEPWDRWFENRIYPSPNGLSIFFTEITERRRAERQLEATARRLAEAQAVAHVGSWEWSVAENRVVWSQEMHRIYGTTPETFDGTYEGFLARVYPEDVAHTRDIIGTAYARPQPFRYYHRIVRSDGQVRMLYTVGEAIAGPDGRVVRMVGSCWDSTGQWEALETILEDIEDALVVLDKGGRVVAASARGRELFARVGGQLPTEEGSAAGVRWTSRPLASGRVVKLTA